MKISKETLLIASFISILTIGYILSYVQKNQLKTSAAGPTATFSLSPSTGTFPLNQQQTMNVVINTDAATNKISGLDLTFLATGNVKIDAVDIISPSKTNLVDGAVAPATMIHNVTATKAQASYIMIQYNAADPLSVNPAPDNLLPASVTMQVKFTGTANGAGTIALDQNASQVVGNITGNVFAIAGGTSASFTIGAGTGATSTPTVTGAPTGPNVTVAFNPSTGTFPLNQQQTMNVVINTDAATNKISGLDLTFLATGNVKIDAVDIISPSKTNLVDGAVAPATMIHNVTATKAQASYIMIQYNAADPLSVNPAPDNLLPASVTMQVKFTGTANGAGTIALDQNASQVVGNITGNVFAYNTVSTGNFTFGTGGTLTPTVTGALTPTVTGTLTPTTTVTPPTGSVVLNMKLKFQGILAQPSNGTTMNVKVMIGKDGFLSAPQTGTFTVNAQGIWSGAVGFNDVTPGSAYRVYVKGPKHVQKKVCDATPTETKGGTYRCSTGALTIAAGQNTIDLSGIYLLVGDLPNQDGVVDSYDTSLIQNNIGKTSAPELAIADLNLDGIIDTQDWSLVIASLNIKYDEL